MEIASMPNYRRAFVPGGCRFFTVNLLDRGSSLLTDEIDVLYQRQRSLTHRGFQNVCRRDSLVSSDSAREGEMPAGVAITREDYTAAELRRAAARTDDANAARRMLAAGRPRPHDRAALRRHPGRTLGRRAAASPRVPANIGAAAGSPAGCRDPSGA